MRWSQVLFSGLLLLLAATSSAAVLAEARAPRGPLNTLLDVRDALRGCWEWPPFSETKVGMDLTVLLSFKSNGEIFGARITYQSTAVSEEERSLYYGVLMRA